MEYAETLKTMVPLLFCFMICALMFVFCFKDMRGVNVNSIFFAFFGSGVDIEFSDNLVVEVPVYLEREEEVSAISRLLTSIPSLL